MWAPVTIHLHSRHHLLQMAKKLPVERGRARHQKVQHGHKLSKFQSKFLWTCSVEVIRWRSLDRFTNIFLDSQEGYFWATNGRDQARARSRGRREPISEAPYGTVVGMAGVASLSLQIIGPRSHIDSMMWSEFLLDMSDTDNIPRRSCTGKLRGKHGQAFQKNYACGTLAHTPAEGMQAGLVQLVQSATGSSEIAAVSLWTLWNSTSTPSIKQHRVEKTSFLSDQRRFMPLLEMHL